MKCGHKFHKNCLEECFKRKPNCPLCREKIKEYSDEGIFRKKIWNLQTHFHPSFRDFSLENNLRAFRARGNPSFSGSSSFLGLTSSSSISRKEGGASSGW